MTQTVATLTFTPEEDSSATLWREVCERAYGVANALTDRPEDITPLEPMGDGTYILGVTLKDGSHGVVMLIPTKESNGRTFPVLTGQEVTETNDPCPLCATEKRRTVGGWTPTLKTLPGMTDRPFCVGLHGFI